MDRDDLEDILDSIRDLLFVQSKIVTTGYISKEYRLLPAEAGNILQKLIDELKEEDRDKDVICSFTLSGYAKDVEESDDLKIYKVLEVDEDEVENCKSSFFSTVDDVVLKSIREKNVSKKERVNFAESSSKLICIRDLSDLKAVQASCPVVDPNIELRQTRCQKFLYLEENRLAQLSQKSLYSQREAEEKKEPKKVVTKNKKDDKKTNMFTKKGAKSIKPKKESDSEEDDVVREGDVMNGRGDSNGHSKDGENDVELIEEPLKEIQIKDESRENNKNNRQVTIDSDDEEEEPVTRKQKMEGKTSAKKSSEKPSTKKGKKEEVKKRKRIMILSDSEEEEPGEESEEEVVKKKRPVKGRNKKKNVLSEEEEEEEMQVDEEDYEEEQKRKAKMNGKVKATGPYDPHSVVEEEILEEDEDGYMVTKKVKRCKKEEINCEVITSTPEVEGKEGKEEAELEEKEVKSDHKKGTKNGKKGGGGEVTNGVAKKKPASKAAVKAPAPGTRKITDFFTRPK